MQDLECQAEEGRVVPATDGIACGFVRVVYLDGQGNLASRLIAPISHIVAPVISMRSLLPRPSSYPLLGPKYLLLGTIYPQLRVQGGSWS